MVCLCDTHLSPLENRRERTLRARGVLARARSRPSRTRFGFRPVAPSRELHNSIKGHLFPRFTQVRTLSCYLRVIAASFSAKAINTADAVWSALSQNRRHATPTLLQSPGHAEKRLLAARRASKANQRAEGIAESAGK